MSIEQLSIPGVWLLTPDKISDERGFFARSWCRRELEEHGLNANIVQTNISRNARANTLRGMHFQRPPHGEVKLVRCTKGAIFDVAVDIRPESETYLQWLGVELTEENHRTLYIPEGFAHGFLTLKDDTEIYYQHTEYYHPESAGGLRWDDPRIAIDWPEWPGERVMSEKDLGWSLIGDDPEQAGENTK